jgi:transcriptional regulator with XRE-family HTH domain
MEPVAGPALSFARLLRQFRAEARLTQEELAEAAGLSPRSVSDLERGVNRTARKDPAVLLADALSLAGEVRVLFVAAARGRALAARRDGAAGGSTAAATRSLPRDTGSFTGREPELARLLGIFAGMAADGGPPGICVTDGMTGIGKTTP